MLNSIFPIIIYLLLGYLFKTYKKDISKELIEFIIYFSLPAMVFLKIYPLDLTFRTLELILMFNVFIFFNLFISYLFAKFLKLEKKTFATFLIVSTFGNTSFIGFTYIEAFYGQDYVVYALIYDLFASFLILVSFGIVIISWGASKTVNIKSISRTVLFFPPIIMFFLAVFLKLFEMPDFVLNASSTIAQTLVPLAMIAIGMKLDIRNIFYKFKIVSLVLFVKMILIPILVMIGFSYFYNLSDIWSKVTILEVAMPPMTMAVVLAIKGGLDEILAINALVLGVIFSLLSVSSFYLFLQ
ncbi:MAG: AEC family transporter [Campylobacteraceae bacterium]|nr:AEC family transporter [Campylobacteraceae bacterium]